MPPMQQSAQARPTGFEPVTFGFVDRLYDSPSLINIRRASIRKAPFPGWGERMGPVGIDYGKVNFMFAIDSRRRVLGLVVGLTAVAASLIVAPMANAEQIAYNCGNDICLINPDNPEEHTNLTESSTANDESPSWSPDGNLIAMVANYLGSFDVFTLDPTKTAAAQEAIAISETLDRGADF